MDDWPRVEDGETALWLFLNWNLNLNLNLNLILHLHLNLNLNINLNLNLNLNFNLKFFSFRQGASRQGGFSLDFKFNFWQWQSTCRQSQNLLNRFVRWNGNMHQVLECWALHNITNVTFTSSGIGTIDGSGDAWSDLQYLFLKYLLHSFILIILRISSFIWYQNVALWSFNRQQIPITSYIWM